MVNGIRLALFKRDHIERTFKWVSDPALRQAFLMRGQPTWEGHLAYFAAALNDPTQQVFTIQENGEHIGNCGLKHIDLNSAAAELWIYLGPAERRGRGAGQAALAELLRHALHELRLRRLVCHVAADNSNALALYRRLGFAEEGTASGEWGERRVQVIRMTLSARST
ncbi:N-acetyltransferase [Oxalobacteraceae bacterium OM1]|nr:N-acetyltransferase [Oxalobacteraceae bacterium OM1]